MPKVIRCDRCGFEEIMQRKTMYHVVPVGWFEEDVEKKAPQRFACPNGCMMKPWDPPAHGWKLRRAEWTVPPEGYVYKTWLTCRNCQRGSCNFGHHRHQREFFLIKYAPTIQEQGMAAALAAYEADGGVEQTPKKKT